MIARFLPPYMHADLEQVERIVQERTRTRAAVISIAGAYLPQPGDPQLRASLVLLAADLGSYRSDRVLHAAAAVELIYAATRTHNGLIDEAARRRGEARNEPWNHGVALMVGDYLFALAAGEMALSPDPRVISYYSHAVLAVSEAELMPVTALRPLERAREQYALRVGGSSSALVAAACRAGAACGGLNETQIEALGAYGHALGMMLQIAAEIRDFAPGNSTTPPASSLRRGKVSLPLIYAAQSGDGARLAAALDSDDRGELHWATDEVRRHGLAPARAELAAQVALAHAALADLPPGEARTRLEGVATTLAVN
jgi:geranylgeranyl pyrophosphate synthase